MFDLPTPTPRLDFNETGVHAAAISPDGKLLALPSHRRVVTGVTRLFRALGALGFGGLLPPGLAQSKEVHEVRLYNAATGRFLRAFPLSKARAYPIVEFSPDSRTLVERHHYCPELPPE